MTPNVDFNMQQALTDMEGRIRDDIKQSAEAARLAAAHAQTVADAALLANAGLTGRVAALEEKAGWAATGIGSLFLGAVGFVWHVLTHR